MLSYNIGTQVNHLPSCKYLGVPMHTNWTWTVHVSNLTKKLGLGLPVFNCILHMLDYEICIAYCNGLVLPQFDYGDIVLLAKALEPIAEFQKSIYHKLVITGKDLQQLSNVFHQTDLLFTLLMLLNTSSFLVNLELFHVF